MTYFQNIYVPIIVHYISILNNNRHKKNIQFLWIHLIWFLSDKFFSNNTNHCWEVVQMLVVHVPPDKIDAFWRCRHQSARSFGHSCRRQGNHDWRGALACASSSAELCPLGSFWTSDSCFWKFDLHLYNLTPLQFLIKAIMSRLEFDLTKPSCCMTPQWHQCCQVTFRPVVRNLLTTMPPL